MAIQWADDFSRYGLDGSSRTAMLDGLPYANLGSGNSSGVKVDPDPNAAGAKRAYRIGFDGNNWPRDFRVALPTVVTGTIGVAFRSWLANLPAAAGERPAVVGVQRGDGNYLVYALVELNGSITVVGRVSGSLVQIADTINPVIQPASWNHWELVHDRATGEGSLYINGIQRVTYTGVDVADNVELVNFSYRSSAGGGANTFVKDLVIWDDTGSQNNSRMGTVIVRALRPNADDTLGGWVPSVGSEGFPLLSKTAVNDATFLSGDDTPPAPMIFDFETLPDDVTSIRAVIPVIRHRKVDGGDANVQVAVSPNGTDWDNGADRPITSAFSYDFDVSELSPDTAAPWTPIEVNDIKGRVDRTV
jgi:hypothetical protein